MARKHRPRFRRTRDQIDEIKSAILQVVADDSPQTVRQIFYQLVARSVIEKTEEEYQGTVIRLLSEMRWSKQIDWEDIVDLSRMTYEYRTFDGPAEALADTAQTYRRSAMRESDAYIEIWCEKEALAGIIHDEAAGEYDVPVVVSKGMPSLSQLHVTFTNIKRAAEAGKQSFIYQFGDHDPTGVLIPKIIDQRMEDFYQSDDDCDEDFILPLVTRWSLTEDHIREYALPTRPTKRAGNSHAAAFEGDSVELDALPSRELRRLVLDCIEQHISPAQLRTLRVAEESEREFLQSYARHAAGGSA